MKDTGFSGDQLLAIYDRVAGADDAIPRLRRFVLDLAVRGKLVEQDAADEPASKLLERIAGKSQNKGVGSAELMSPADPPFLLPVGWGWSDIGSLCSKTGSGSTPRGGKEVYTDFGIPFLRSQNVYDEGLRLDDVAFISPEVHARMSGTKVIARDLLLNITGGSMGRCCLVPDGFDEANVSQHVAIIRPAQQEMSDFLHLLVRSPYFQAFIFGEQTGAGRGGLPKNRMDRILAALPPLAEQKRIVAKVAELMGLLDQLEQTRARAEAVRGRLTTATWARLTADAADDPSHARHTDFALKTLPALTTTPTQIKTLRQSILNLAVRGKLVAQDPADEPAAELLRRIERERAAKVKGAKLRARRPIPFVDKSSIASLPDSWRIEAIGNLVDPTATISYGVLVPGPDVSDGIPFVRAQDLALSGHPERPNKTIAPEIEAPYARTRLRGGEILLCVVGSIGKLGVAPQSWAGANIARAVARISPVASISSDYLLLAMRSDLIQTYCAEATRTLAQPTLNVGLIEVLPIPLPPLAEQHRIVAKVDALMALCDQLETALATTATTRARLLETLIRRALSADAEVMEAAE